MREQTILNHKYRLRALIGKGGFGEVYRALDIQLQREVAVKVLRRDISAHQEAASRFLSEARLTSRLTHSHTLTIHDFGVHEGQLFLVSELLRGETLHQRLARVQVLRPQELVNYMMPVCRALHEAHMQGIIHRDLKPENLFIHNVLDEEKMVVLDFGIAKSIDALHVTQTGHIFGTPSYMAPEQIKTAEAITSAVDIYSLGVILYRSLAGTEPYQGNTLFDIFEKHVSAEIPLLTHTVSPLLEPLDQLIRAMLAKRPEERPKSMIEVAERLRSALDQLSPELNTLEIISQHPRSSSPSDLQSAAHTPSLIETFEAPEIQRASRDVDPRGDHEGLTGAVAPTLDAPQVALTLDALRVAPTLDVPQVAPTLDAPRVAQRGKEVIPPSEYEDTLTPTVDAISLIKNTSLSSYTPSDESRDIKPPLSGLTPENRASSSLWPGLALAGFALSSALLGIWYGGLHFNRASPPHMSLHTSEGSEISPLVRSLDPLSNMTTHTSENGAEVKSSEVMSINTMHTEIETQPESRPEPAPPYIQSVHLEFKSQASFVVGEHVRVKAWALDQHGERFKGPKLKYIVYPPRIARVKRGRLHFMHRGEAMIKVCSSHNLSLCSARRQLYVIDPF